MAKYTLDIDVNYKSVEDLRTELKALEAEFETAAIGSDRFKSLGAQVKAARNQVKDLEAQFEGLDKEQRATALVDTFTGLVGAVGAVSSAFIAFGGNAEAIEGAEKKLLGVIGVVNGLRDASNGLVAAGKLFGPTFTAVGDSIKAGFTAGATGAQTFKAALISTGIGAFIVAVGLLVANFDKLFGSAEAAKKAIEDINSTLERQIQVSDDLIRRRQNDAKIQEALLKSQGKSEEEISALRQANYAKDRDAYLKRIQEINAAQDAALAKFKGTEEEKTKLITQFNVQRQAAIVNYNNAEVALELEKIKLVDEANKKAAEKAKARNQNELEAKKSLNESLRKLDEANATEGLDAINTQYANELARIKEAQAEELKQDNLSAQARKDIKARFAADIATNEINRQKEVDDYTKAQNEKAIEDAKTYAENVQSSKEKEYQDTLKSVTEFFAQQELIQKQNLANGLITQQQFDQQLLQINAEKNQALLTAAQDYGQSTIATETAIADAQITLNNNVKASEQAKQQAQLEFLQAAQGAVSALGGLFEEGSDAAKAAALVDIAVGTGVGFVRALTIAQESAAATGPAAAFAFPIFYASQIAAVLGAASRAKAVLNSGKGGGASAPSKTTTPSIPSATNSAQGFLGGLPQLATSTGGVGATGGYGGSQTGGPRGGVFKTYVLAGDVTSAQAAEAKINQRRQF
jgi:hypothetical protein